MSKNCVIFETLNRVSEMQVEKTGGLMTLHGTFGVCGVRNNNQRVYETSNYSKMVSEMQARIKADGAVAGELEHPQTMNITLENISHKITEINIDENGVVSGTIQLLDTPKGKIAQAIVEGGLPLFVSSRATGQVAKDGKVTLERLATYDLVATPGFSQARMHLNESQVCESIDDRIVIISEKEDNNISMTNEEILEKLATMEARIVELETTNEQLREQLEESVSSNIDLQKLANGIQDWIVNEYSPSMQNWLTEHFAEYMQEKCINETKQILVKKVAPGIQSWCIEHFAPEIEKWIVENYSPEVEKWVINAVAPGIQSWCIEHFAPEIENWVTESYGQQVKSMIDENLKSDNNDKLKSLKDTLSLLESIDVQKPNFGGRIITENQETEPLYIANMPESARVKWNMASNEVRESIERRAKLFNFTNEGAIERFWEHIDFDALSQNTPAKPVHEDLSKIVDQRERVIRESFRRKRNLF